jgi:hypothetical protein
VSPTPPANAGTDGDAKMFAPCLKPMIDCRASTMPGRSAAGNSVPPLLSAMHFKGANVDGSGPASRSDSSSCNL